jgi:multidrug efflux system outer membrane protein
VDFAAVLAAHAGAAGGKRSRRAEALDAQRSLFNAQLSLVSTQSQLFQSYANLYRAMGGGWVADAEKLASNPPPPSAK